MAHTFSKITELFNTPHLIQFTAPVPITICVERLQEGIGKPMGCMFARIEGDIEKVDEATYQFTLYQDYRGGHTVTGRLTAQTSSTTRIDALHTVDRSSWLTGLLFVVVVIIMAFTVEISKADLVAALGLSIIFVGITTGIMFASLKAHSISQLVWWFERTLKQ